MAILFGCSLGVCLGQTPPKSVTPQARPDLEWYQKGHTNRLQKAAQGGWEVVLVGDSITSERMLEAATLKKYKVLNLGCPGDRTENVLWRFENGEIDGLQPRLVILLIGTNNSGHRRDPPDQIAAGVRLIIDTLRARMPDARILLLAILPRGPNSDDSLRVNNEKTNALIKNIADDQSVFFLDVNDRLLKPDGTLCDGYKPDNLHLNPKGYEILAQALTPAVTKLMEKPAGQPIK